MIDAYEDQAAGLRRLFRNAPPTVLALYVTGHHRRRLAFETAEQLTENAQRVLVLDEVTGAASLNASLALESLDLLHTLDERYKPSSVVQRLDARIARLPVAAAAMALPLLDESRRGRLLDALQSLTRYAGHVLVHAEPGAAGAPSPFVHAAPRRLLVAEASGRGATEAYALIKQLAGAGAGSLHVAVARAKGRADARGFFNTLDGLVQRHVGVSLAWLGELERDSLAAGLSQPINLRHPREPEEAFMRKLAAWGRDAGLMPASR